MLETYEVKSVSAEDEVTTILFPKGVEFFANYLGVDLVMVDGSGDVFTWTKGSKEWMALGHTEADIPHDVLKVVPKNKN